MPQLQMCHFCHWVILKKGLEVATWLTIDLRLKLISDTRSAFLMSDGSCKHSLSPLLAIHQSKFLHASVENQRNVGKDANIPFPHFHTHASTVLSLSKGNVISGYHDLKANISKLTLTVTSFKSSAWRMFLANSTDAAE